MTLTKLSLQVPMSWQDLFEEIVSQTQAIAGDEFERLHSYRPNRGDYSLWQIHIHGDIESSQVRVKCQVACGLDVYETTWKVRADTNRECWWLKSLNP
jgi:hypothetical protein